LNRAPPPLSQLLLGPSLHCCRRNSIPTDRANAPGFRIRPTCESDSATRAVTRADYTVLQAFVHAHVKVENRGGAALRLGDAVRGVAFRTLGPARHRPLSNHLSTRYDNKVVRVRVCGSGGGSGSGCGCVYVCMMARGVWWTVGAPASTERNKRDYPPSARLLFMHLYLVLRSSLSILPFDVKRVPPSRRQVYRRRTNINEKLRKMRSQAAKKVKNAKAPRIFLKATDREPARRNLLGEIYLHGNLLGSS